MKTAFLFPGQGAQFVGMGKDLYDHNKQAHELFDRADKRLDYSLTSIIFEGPEETLTRTEHTQPAILTVSIACLEAFKEYGITPDYVAGHSLGEYSALCAAGSLSFEDAVYAVHMRGLFMEEAVPAGVGTMAAILGADREMLKEVTEEVTKNGDTVELANVNCPGQIVISGTKDGVEKASQLAKERGAKRVIPLVVSGPFHSSLMAPAADKLSAVLDEVSILDSKIPIINNVEAQPMTEKAIIKEKLLLQLTSPVLFEDTVKTLLDLGVDTFIEIGPGRVLSGLVKKVHRRAKVYSISDLESLEQTIQKLKEDSPC